MTSGAIAHYHAPASLTKNDTAKQYHDMRVIKKLNQAKFSVFLSYSQSQHKSFALKIFPYIKTQINPYYVNEIRFANFKNQNVISVLHYEAEKAVGSVEKQKTMSFILSEYAPYGDFFELILTKNLKFDEKLCRTYFSQLMNGLDYLHSLSVGHMDLKPENLLLGENFQLKIADFDNAVLNNKFQSPCLGTKYYRAPEIIDNRCKDVYAADIFSAGVILFLFKCGGALPHLEHEKFQGVDLRHLLEHNESMFWETHIQAQGKPAEFFDEDFRALFTSMTVSDPKKRATIRDVLSSKWLNGPIYSDEELIQVMKQAF